jgi:hypothetical protein
MFGRRAAAPVRDGLVIGPADRVHGTVQAQAVTVAGGFDGKLTVEASLAVLASGRLTGTISSARLSIEAGAVVRATCRVGAPKEKEEEVIAFDEVTVVDPAVHAAPPRVRDRERETVGGDGPPMGAGLGW